MDLAKRVKKSRLLSAHEKLVMGLLKNESMTAKTIVDTLMSEPYNLTFYEVFNAIRRLRKKGLIILHDFAGYIDNFEIDTYLTFAPDWVAKL